MASYGEANLKNAVAGFASKYPKLKMQIANRTHESLHEALKSETCDLVLNDQRRAFSDKYVNIELCETKTFVQIASSNPLSKKNNLTTENLKNIPCIVAANEKSESTFYSDILGFTGGFVFAKNLQEARLLVTAGSGVMPVKGINLENYFDSAIMLVPLLRGEKQVSRKYCAF